MTPALPLPLHDGANTQAIFDLIANSAIDTGGRSIKLRFGTSSVTFTASADSAQKTIPHGMGSVPVLVLAFQRAPLLEFAFLYEPLAADATNIYIKGHQLTTIAVTNTQNIYWLAFG